MIVKIVSIIILLKFVHFLIFRVDYFPEPEIEEIEFEEIEEEPEEIEPIGVRPKTLSKQVEPIKPKSKRLKKMREGVYHINF